MSVCRYICKYRSDHRPLQSWASQRTITKCIFLNAYPPSVISVIEVAIFLYRGREADTVRGRLAAGVHLRGCYNPDGKLVDVQEPKTGKEYILFLAPLCPGAAGVPDLQPDYCTGNPYSSQAGWKEYLPGGFSHLYWPKLRRELLLGGIIFAGMVITTSDGRSKVKLVRVTPSSLTFLFPKHKLSSS